MGAVALRGCPAPSFDEDNLESLLNSKIRIGTAGWTVPTHLSSRFEKDGTHLERYAKTFNAVEINSSFYHQHKPETYKRWAQCVPSDFKFSVKLNQIFTHDQRLNVNEAELTETLEGIRELDDKWSSLLVQLPPSLIYSPSLSDTFFSQIRQSYSGPIVLEPRHRSWIKSIPLMKRFGISKVKADPEPVPIEDSEYQHQSVLYYRLHGSPDLYRSSYSYVTLRYLGLQMQSHLDSTHEIWCIFDNTALSHAMTNAFELNEIISELPIPHLQNLQTEERNL